MRNFNTALLSAMLVGWLFGGPWWYANNYRSVSPTVNTSFSINSDNLKLSAKDNFYFSKSSPDISVPQSTRLAFIELAEYLNEDPNRRLELTGVYFPSEVNDAAFDNLGLARAEALKVVLIAQGALPQRISTKGLKSSNSSLENNMLYGGVHFSFYKTAKSNVAKTPVLEDNKNAIVVESLNLYFTKSKYKLKMTPELEAYFGKLKKYLQFYPEAKLSITGHTDNLGKRKDNLRLSKYRAKKVRDFMVKHGFSIKKLKLAYKGSDDPLEDNATEKGRKKNRRVEIRIQN